MTSLDLTLVNKLNMEPLPNATRQRQARAANMIVDQDMASDSHSTDQEMEQADLL